MQSYALMHPSEGIPVAWIISNREDSLTLIQFLKAIKERLGSLSPTWFMSDDAEQLFTAWRAVFGDNQTKKLLCAWHVDSAWRQGQRKHVQTKSDQVEIYHYFLQNVNNQNSDLFYNNF